jgi:hypothetical protein
MSQQKDKKGDELQKIKSALSTLIKKRENEYNSCGHISMTEMNAIYNDNVVIYTSFDKCELIQNKKKGMEIEKKIYTNTDKNHSIKISTPTFIGSDHLLCVQYQIDFHESISSDMQQMIQKLTIKDVNMDQLISDLNQNGINVNNLLIEFNKNGKNLDSLLAYLDAEKISLTNIMTILYRNNVTINGLVQNDFIHTLIKQSPTYAWFLNGKELPKKTVKAEIKSCKCVKKIHVYAMYKIRHDEYSLININWTYL